MKGEGKAMDEKTTEAKAALTAILWIAMSVITVVAIANDIRDPAIVMGPLGIAFVMTFVLWVLADVITQPQGQTPQSRQVETAEKAKRGDSDARLALLLDMMDADERDAFKEQLKAEILQDMRGGNDGELNSRLSLSDLLDEEEQLRSQI